MVYTVKELAEISHVSVRTLHWYDEIGLLKPTYHGSNGYRYYEEPELLTLQQILFFRELGFDLKQISKLLKRGDFDKITALSAHREVLCQDLKRIRKLIKTIDKTLEHLKGFKKMKDKELYEGFCKEKQAEHEAKLIELFGEKAKIYIDESRKHTANWSKTDWDNSNHEFNAICAELTEMKKKQFSSGSKQVQKLIRQHYEWIKKFWTPTRESYAAHGQFIIESELKKVYEAFHPALPEYIAEGIQQFANCEL